MKAVKKKISIFLMTLMLASTFSANVTKADVIESKNTFAYEEIMPYATVCPRCGGRITSSTVWGSWISSGTVTCTHGHACIPFPIGWLKFQFRRSMGKVQAW